MLISTQLQNGSEATDFNCQHAQLTEKPVAALPFYS